MARIAVGGFQHETNTFAPDKADFAAFEQADGWPGLSKGAALFDAVAGVNLPMAGFVEAARSEGHDLVPLLWCAAVPCAHVTEDAFERIAGMMLEGIAAAKADAVYLDLHGAMVAEHFEDAEGELLRRVRDAVGDVPVVASLDLHANVTWEMAALSSGLVAYRTYPHIDMAETGARAARLLARLLATGQGTPAQAFHKLDFLMPIYSQCTTEEPCAGLYTRLAELEGGDVWSLSFTPGFPPADIADCGPAVFGVGADQAAVDRAVGTLAREIAARETDFAGPLYEPDEAVRLAMASNDPRPVVLADTQDNPGGGGNGDTVGMLDALVRGGAQGAVFALVYDPEVAAAAHAAGKGAVIEAALGAKSGQAGHAPFRGRFAVERLADGRMTATGPVFLGNRMNLGPMALLRVEDAGGADVRVVVASRKMQAADQAILRHVGIEPAEQRILVLKSSVHFRADFQPIAAQVLTAVAPGPVLADSTKYPYVNLREGVRLAPGGAPFRRAGR